jgi:hypothetical protein
MLPLLDNKNPSSPSVFRPTAGQILDVIFERGGGSNAPMVQLLAKRVRIFHPLLDLLVPGVHRPDWFVEAWPPSYAFYPFASGCLPARCGVNAGRAVVLGIPAYRHEVEQRG